MAKYVFPERCYHFLKVRNGALDPWRWTRGTQHATPRNVIVLNEASANSVVIGHADPEIIEADWVRYHGDYRVMIINRGAPVTFHNAYPTANTVFPYVLNKNSQIILTDRGRSVRLIILDSGGDHMFFHVDHFDMMPRVLSDHIHSDNDRLHGIIAFSCDWEGTSTVELWVDGATKLAKFQNIGSGEHVLEYSIPGPVVKGWSREGTRMVNLELRTLYQGHERIVWSGATLAVKTALPQG